MVFSSHLGVLNRKLEVRVYVWEVRSLLLTIFVIMETFGQEVEKRLQSIPLTHCPTSVVINVVSSVSPFPSTILKQLGESVLVTLNFVCLQVRRVEQFGRECFKLSGVGSRVNRSRIYFQDSYAASVFVFGPIT